VCRGIGLTGDDEAADDDEKDKAAAAGGDAPPAGEAVPPSSVDGAAAATAAAATPAAATKAADPDADVDDKVKSTTAEAAGDATAATTAAGDAAPPKDGDATDATAATTAGEAKPPADSEDDEENDVFNFKGERYMPARVLAGLLPSALLDQYNFWQQAGGDLIGESKSDDVADTEIHVRMVPRAKVSCTGGEGVCARIVRRRKRREALPNEKAEASAAAAAPTSVGDDDEPELMLLNLIYAPIDTPLFSVARQLARIEDLSHVLVWTPALPYDELLEEADHAARERAIKKAVDEGKKPPTFVPPSGALQKRRAAAPSALRARNERVLASRIELPRLKIAFQARTDVDGVTRLYSLDHTSLFVPQQAREDVGKLLRGIPHSILLSNHNGELHVLVPNVSVTRPPVGNAPFSTELVLCRPSFPQGERWAKNTTSPYFLYEIHVSNGFMVAPTLPSALYLLMLRLFYRDYDAAAGLVTAIGTDAAHSKEESQIFASLGINDRDPDAHACRLRITLAVADSPIECAWDERDEYGRYCEKVSHVSARCRLSADDEAIMSARCALLTAKEGVVRRVVVPQFNRYHIVRAARVVRGSMVGDVDDRRRLNAMLAMVRDAMWAECEAHVEREEFARLATNAADNVRVSPHLAQLTKNRAAHLQALRDGSRTAQCTSTKPRQTGLWMTRSVRLAVIAGAEEEWQTLQLPYGRASTPLLSSSAAANVMMGMYYNHMPFDAVYPMYYPDDFGFLQAYELMQGRLKFGWLLGKTSRAAHAPERRDVQRSFAALFILLHRDALAEDTFLNAIGRLMLFNARANEMALPRLKDDRDQKTDYFKAYTDDNESKSPLARMFRELMPALRAQYKAGKVHGGRDASKLKSLPPPPTRAVVPRAAIDIKAAEAAAAAAASGVVRRAAITNSASTFDTMVACQVSNYSAAERELRLGELNWDALGLGADGDVDALTREGVVDRDTTLRTLREQVKAVPDFFGKPMAPVDVDKYVVRVSAQRVESAMPFDVRAHPYAQSAVAEAMMSRLEADMEKLAKRSETSTVPELRTHDGRALGTVFASGAAAADTSLPRAEFDALLAHYVELERRMVALKTADSDFVTAAVPVIVAAANDTSAAPPGRDRDVFLLLRLSRQRTPLWLQYIIASMLSTGVGAAHGELSGIDDWRALNPFVRDETFRVAMQLVTRMLLHANRVGHANRAIEACRAAIELLRKAQSRADAAAPTVLVPAALAAGVMQQSSTLASLLDAKRAFVAKDASGRLVFDPRFLVFEFTWNLLLRSRQVELVREFAQSVAAKPSDRRGSGIVKQMIMGAGKTTVVGPLLCLLLADGDSLITMVVPSALVEFSRGVLRRTFSSIVRKRVYTLTFDRNDDLGPRIESKLRGARDSGAVVIATPASVRSLMLKFVEMLALEADPNAPVWRRSKRAGQAGTNILQMWREGVVLMDEVDVVLHPLKSELNFPIGAKQPIDFAGERWELPIHVLEAIFAVSKAIEAGRRVVSADIMGRDPSVEADRLLAELQTLFEEGFKRRFMQRNPHVVLLNRDFYHAQIKPVIARWVVLHLRSRRVGNVLPTEQAVEYLVIGYSDQLAKTAENESRLRRSFELEAAILHGLSENERKLLNLGRDWCETFLPHALQKIDRVTFGIMSPTDYASAMQRDPRFPRSRSKLAIPFVGKDVPSPASEFAHPDVLIGLTILAYRYESLRFTDFEEIVGKVQSAFGREMGKKTLRPSAVLYAQWVRDAGGAVAGSYRDLTRSAAVDGADAGPTVVLPLDLLKRSNHNHMQPLFELLRRSASVIHYYLREFIFPEYMRYQTTKLSASGQDLGGSMLFGRRIGFSGTPSESDAARARRVPASRRAARAQVLHVLTDASRSSAPTLKRDGWTVALAAARRGCKSPP
jgi:hypothetical protein